MAAKRSNIVLGILAAIILIGLTQTLFVVDQTEKAILLQLGKPVGETYGPGLHIKMPLVQNVIYFDSRILDYDARPEEILTEDKKTMVVDHYSKWRISDPLKFYRRARTIPGAQARLDDIIAAAVREALGRYSLIDLVAHKRQDIMDQVNEEAQKQAEPYGIKVIDVRIKRTDLPAENARAIYGRMKAERERQAKQYRSEGREASSRITAQADKERTVLLAEAQKGAEIARGEGDAKAVKIYAKALNQSPEFYEFQRSLEAYEKSLKDNTRVILTPKTPFLKHFN